MDAMKKCEHCGRFGFLAEAYVNFWTGIAVAMIGSILVNWLF
jgi:hypothetical protein